MKKEATHPHSTGAFDYRRPRSAGSPLHQLRRPRSFAAGESPEADPASDPSVVGGPSRLAARSSPPLPHSCSPSASGARRVARAWGVAAGRSKGARSLRLPCCCLLRASCVRFAGGAEGGGGELGKKWFFFLISVGVISFLVYLELKKGRKMIS